MAFPYVFTFYSYKGGVGRSLAVMNVAYTLAGWGRHVLMVDMDLEAPGISSFLQRSNELAEPNSAHPKDVLTLLGEAARILRNGGAPDEMECSLPPVSNYIRSVAEERLAALRPQLGLLGRLDVLGTDLSRDYLGRLAQLGLKDLPQGQLIALSRLLHRYLKAQIFPHRPLGIEDFEPPIQTPYDYVLIDSRTGITEIGGLCVGPLADRLVVITGLNDQNVSGTLRFLDEAGIQPKPRSRDGQAWDDADPLNEEAVEISGLGPKPTIVVASPVPAGEITYKRQRLSDLEKLLGIRPVSLSYHPQMALMETVFVRDYPEEYLALEYKGLASRLTAQVGDDAKRLAFQTGILWNEKKEPAKAIACALRVASQVPELGTSLLRTLLQSAIGSGSSQNPEMRQLYAIITTNAALKPVALDMQGVFSNYAIALAELASRKTGEVADRLLAMARAKFEAALAVKPDTPEVLYNWAVLLANESSRKPDEEAEQLLAEAVRKYSEVLRLRPDFPEALYNLGVALHAQAKTKEGEEADRLLAGAISKYAEAVRLKPDHHEALTNWGVALYAQAGTKTGGEADRLLAEAGAKYAEALRLRPGDHNALNNWGAALNAQAKTKVGEEADRLFTMAGDKFEAALTIKPDMFEALTGWGLTLAAQARRKTGEKGDRLFALALGKYEAALAIKPHMPGVLVNWGSALAEQAQRKMGEEADRLFTAAAVKFEAALAIKPDLYDALISWGASLHAQAKVKEAGEADRLFASVGDKYAQVLRLKPTYHQVLYNWGLALADQARMKEGVEADGLFAAAGAKYAEALRLRPNYHEALVNWASALAEQARTKAGVEADRLFAEADAKYAKALELSPDSHIALTNWSLALLDQATRKIGEEADPLLAQAEELLLRAAQIEPDQLYNLACLAALRSKSEECRELLFRCLKAGTLPDITQLAADANLAAVRDSEWFQDLLREARSRQTP